MELISIYQIVMMTTLLRGVTDLTQKTFIAAGVIALVVWLALFILQGIGLSKMAENRGMKRRYLAFIPFANIIYIGKLAGTCEFFGQKMKRAGLYAMLLQVITFVISLAVVIVEGYLYLACADHITIDAMTGDMVWTGLHGLEYVSYNFYLVAGETLTPILGFCYEIMMFVLIMGLFKKYSAKNYMILSFAQLFFPYVRFVAIFAVRNNKAIDYDAYMKARYEEAYARRQAYYNSRYGNPYGQAPYGQNPYGQNPYGTPYGNPYGNPQATPENPFDEFANSEPKDVDPFSDINDYGKDRERRRGGENQENPFVEQSQEKTDKDDFFA